MVKAYVCAEFAHIAAPGHEYCARLTQAVGGPLNNTKGSAPHVCSIRSAERSRCLPPYGVVADCRNLVDPASSYMLVSKIKPCMSQQLSSHDMAANGSLYQI